MTRPTPPMMRCGHAACSKLDDGSPCCVICYPDPRAREVDIEAPDLTGRMAKCSMCSATARSSADLAFFEYRGPGSREATEACARCGYYKCAHEYDPDRRVPEPRDCRFVPRGDRGVDGYYCGCRGWD